MTQVGAFEAKNSLGALLDRVEHGEEITITRHGRPVARLVPTEGATDRSQIRAAVDRIRQRASQLKPEPVDWQTLKADRDADRP